MKASEISERKIRKNDKQSKLKCSEHVYGNEVSISEHVYGNEVGKGI